VRDDDRLLLFATTPGRHRALFWCAAPRERPPRGPRATCLCWSPLARRLPPLSWFPGQRPANSQDDGR